MLKYDEINMASAELVKYIESARAKQMSDDVIKMQLIKAGWNESEVSEVLKPSLKVDDSLIPPPVPRIGMWVSFQYVLLFISLYIWTISLGGIAYHATDRLIKDPLDRSAPSMGGLDNPVMKGYLAAIIVAYPIFVLLFLRLKKLSYEKPFTKSLGSRKALIYLTLVITFLILITHLIAIIYGVLDGDIKGRSIAHFIITLSIAGSVFFYLLHDVREDRKSL